MLIELLVNVAASAVLLAFGFLVGKLRERRSRDGKKLEEYDFYPFALDENKVLYFDLEKFCVGVHHFLKYRDYYAAQQLIIVGKQNDVGNRLTGEEATAYRTLYKKFDGDKVFDDTAKFLENYVRIVRLIGDSFPDSGMEILLHNLTNPSKALYHIKNNVTGRNIDAPATNLVLDLKTRRLQNQDKLNYELNIGARKFKCTTIPIYRDNYGLVAAICINLDANYVRSLPKNEERLFAFIDTLCKTDMELDENILSKDEYDKALAGKRHFRDFAVS
jgi:predicted transcriptional regulator YheO